MVTKRRHNPDLSNEDFKHFIATIMHLVEAEKELKKLINIFQKAGMERTSVYSFLVKNMFKIRMIIDQLKNKEV